MVFGNRPLHMKTVILCGGKGTRMKEETEYRPKPLVEIGGKPILWHIMKIYAHYGFNEFVVALGYKGEMIKDYFLKLPAHAGNFTLATRANIITAHGNGDDDFVITFADTGQETETGGRIQRVKPYLENDEAFMVTYGDGVADINIPELVAFHHTQGTIGTITGAQPHSKYGFVETDAEKNIITAFHEKPLMHDQYVNSGFMVFQQNIFDHIDDGMFEATTLPKLARERNLSLYRHKGFWKAMDTYKEVEDLNRLWAASKPWKVWAD